MQVKAQVCPHGTAAVKSAPARQPRPQTFTRLALHHFCVVEGWRAIYVDDNGAHWSAAIQALGLGSSRRYASHTGQRRRDSSLTDDAEAWEIFGLTYHMDEGWVIAEDSANFCALLPPGMTLEDFEAQHCCHWAS